VLDTVRDPASTILDVIGVEIVEVPDVIDGITVWPIDRIDLEEVER